METNSQFIDHSLDIPTKSQINKLLNLENYIFNKYIEFDPFDQEELYQNDNLNQLIDIILEVRQNDLNLKFEERIDQKTYLKNLEEGFYFGSSLISSVEYDNYKVNDTKNDLLNINNLNVDKLSKLIKNEALIYTNILNSEVDWWTYSKMIGINYIASNLDIIGMINNNILSQEFIAIKYGQVQTDNTPDAILYGYFQGFYDSVTLLSLNKELTILNKLN